MALTTMVAFNSLIFSGIRPVIDFGWMMATGVMMALIIVFVFFPVFLLIAGKRTESNSGNNHSPVTDFFAWLTLRHSVSMIVANIFLAVVILLGLGRLQVENSFIDYFHESTEIHKGMKIVDQRLGGTTPLEIILNFPPPAAIHLQLLKISVDALSDSETNSFFEDDDDFGDDFSVEPEDPNKYWFSIEK